MKAHNNIYPVIDLQLFADSGAAGVAGAGGDSGNATGSGVTGEAAVPQKGVKRNPLANVKYGKQAESAPVAEVQGVAQTTVQDRQAEFEKLIKGDFKDLYDAKVQDTIQKRLKSTKEVADKYTALAPTLEVLAKKYGVKADDIEALNKAIEDDDSYFEDEAMKKGMTVEQLKEVRKIEKENEALRAQMQEKNARENASRQYAAWIEQAKQAKATYPQLDLAQEIKNPQFVELLKNNIDVGSAYLLVHKDEIIPAAMQYTAKTVEQKLTNKMISGGARPSENGNSSQSAALVKDDVASLSKADRQEIIRRVQRGEKIRF